mmetsp:Transcript_99463/g.197098  ORF Transcript_99463/g.197098 Transcript_99463/m.197098 type:complete len:127 (-) Transcript_99463:252-632(-)|eukprot:CAMPEP_0172677086 /NCGR_PEP_ID=MMETSP1074-20121228/14433_1 /TAXON_ID=2916 /ORGANISM="Ceratium fusus, Strain PA161109" /LENGTH=126 /DNA_ID=CAMNT_0013494865 /DNA_START=56 /DNA_END=436 /DNA_ORIENTATION=-
MGDEWRPLPMEMIWPGSRAKDRCRLSHLIIAGTATFWAVASSAGIGIGGGTRQVGPENPFLQSQNPATQLPELQPPRGQSINSLHMASEGFALQSFLTFRAFHSLQACAESQVSAGGGGYGKPASG